MTDFASFTRIPDHLQNLDTTSSSRCIPADVAVVRATSSANPLLFALSPFTVLKPTPDRRRPVRSALKTMLKSVGDRMSPCLVPRNMNTGADRPYGRSAS